MTFTKITWTLQSGTHPLNFKYQVYFFEEKQKIRKIVLIIRKYLGMDFIEIILLFVDHISVIQQDT